MKKNVKRVCAAALTGAMLLLLPGCENGLVSNVNDGTVNQNTEQTDFYIMGGQSALSAGYNDLEVLNDLQENVGIHIDWETMSDSLSEQVNIRITGGQLPDAFQGVGFSNYDLARYGDDGTFLDLTPYLTPDIMPNLCAILESHPEIRAAVTMEDGGIYGLPSGEQMTTAGIGADMEDAYSIFSVPQYSMINKAWLDDLGLEVPTSLDELHDVLKAFKDNDMSAKYYGNAAGSTIPMTTGFDEWCWGQNIFYSGFGFTNWPNDVCNDLHLKSDGTVEFVCVTDAYRDCLTYFHDWYAEGLMDTEMFSQSDSQLIAKCQQGYVGVSAWWYIEELMGEYADDYVFLPPLSGPKGTKYEGTCDVTIRPGSPISSGQLCITNKCQSPINLLKFYDQWYDGETVMQLQYGPKGVFFTEQEEGTGMWLSITDEEARAKYGKSAGELRNLYEVYGPKLILAEYYNSVFYMEDRAIERLTDLDTFWMPFVQDTTFYPVDCVFTGMEMETIDWHKSDFETSVREQEGLWIKEGGPTDEEWEAYKKRLSEKCGMDDLLETYQNAYDRYSAAD
ncbi:extracellular solute-binding protein [Frisingicoccus sp.]|uniref:extracellular solute-binding protein n=1 Tax=Frisingicoccus sp. TaxID=1918627 RepID=UPI003AB65B49